MPDNFIQDGKDPFSLDAIRITNTTDESIGIERPILSVPVMNPPKQSYIRVHDSPDKTLDARIIKFDTEREVYLVTPEMAMKLPGETKAVRLLVCMPRHGGIFLWPLALPNPNVRENAWHTSARKAAELAKTTWVRMQANMAVGMYDVTTSKHIPDPVFPDISMRDLLSLAFGDGRLIDRDDHPVVRQLMGAC